MQPLPLWVGREESLVEKSGENHMSHSENNSTHLPIIGIVIISLQPRAWIILPVHIWKMEERMFILLFVYLLPKI